MSPRPANLTRRAWSGLVLLTGCWLQPVNAGEPVVLTARIHYAQATPAAFGTHSTSAAQILDLRGQTVPADLAAWARAPGPLRLVLLDASATAAAADALAHRAGNVLTLSPTAAAIPGDLTVGVTPAEVSASVAAIAAGADIKVLALPTIEKRRFDESALVRRRHGDDETSGPAPEPADPEAPAPPAAADPDPTNTDTTKPPPAPPNDPMLRRAVEVIQGLQALGRD